MILPEKGNAPRIVPLSLAGIYSCLPCFSLSPATLAVRAGFASAKYSTRHLPRVYSLIYLVLLFYYLTPLGVTPIATRLIDTKVFGPALLFFALASKLLIKPSNCARASMAASGVEFSLIP